MFTILLQCKWGSFHFPLDNIDIRYYTLIIEYRYYNNYKKGVPHGP